MAASMTEITEAINSVAAWCTQPTKLGSRIYPALGDVSSIKYTDVNKHVVVSSPLSDRQIVQLVGARNPRVTFLATDTELHWAPQITFSFVKNKGTPEKYEIRRA
ncbi:unnamed protein product [Ixodes pacificus]